jgi:hypothetical protein
MQRNDPVINLSQVYCKGNDPAVNILLSAGVRKADPAINIFLSAAIPLQEMTMNRDGQGSNARGDEPCAAASR